MSLGVPQCVPLQWRQREIAVETQWVGVADPQAPCMVFLHEGLGSVAMWKDFPHTLCQALGFRGLVYSRPGYGQSTPRLPDEHWDPDFMHRQAHEVLPALLAALGLLGGAHKLWLFGHSDGASIALLYAAQYPQTLAGLIVLAPHTFVEDKCIAAIEGARVAYQTTDLPKRLARYHANPDSAFGGWNGVWLNPAFRHWNIDPEVGTLTLPILAVQGVGDEYGTLEQVRRIARHTPKTSLLELPACGHSPHKDQAGAVTEAVRAFVAASD